jgi:4-amino-4-deoxy-L-arabinose transferase-like glycosyltransferase
LGAVLAATLFRGLPLLENRFHPDEALYAFFGRLIASGRDGLLAQAVVDKPPLPLYLLAGSFSLLGGSEFAARLPTFFASVVSVALVYALGRRLYGRRAAGLAAWFLALSPFAVLFSITLFFDPLLTAFGLWGLWMAAAGRPRLAGLAFALCFATKQTAVFYLPLALALGLLRLPAGAGRRLALGQLRRLAVPLAAGLLVATLVVFGWDAVRREFGASIGFWQQGFSDNMPDRLIRSGEVLLRAAAWLDLLSYGTASPLLNWLLVFGMLALLAAGHRSPSRAALADWILAGYLLAYLGAYWLLAFNVWDRYLVPVLPILGLLLARVVELAVDRLRRWLGRLRPENDWRLPAIIRRLMPFTACLLLLPSTLIAARSGYPIGGDHGAYTGLDDTASYLNALPSGTVLYDFWLSWQWNYYLFDGQVYVAWMPSPEALAADLRAFGRASPRYLVVPSWESGVEVAAAAGQAGFRLEVVHESFRPDGSRAFVMYHLK